MIGPRSRRAPISCSGRRTGPGILYPSAACGSALRSNLRARPIAPDLRQEPGTGKPHAGICAGGREKSLSLPRQANPNNPMSHVFLAAALAQFGRPEEARAATRTALTINPQATITRFRAAIGSISDNPVFLAGHDRVVEGLRMAGMPEG